VDVNESERDRDISLLLAVAMHCDVTTDCRGGKIAVNKHEHAQSVNNALIISVPEFNIAVCYRLCFIIIMDYVFKVGTKC